MVQENDYVCAVKGILIILETFFFCYKNSSLTKFFMYVSRTKQTSEISFKTGQYIYTSKGVSSNNEPVFIGRTVAVFGTHFLHCRSRGCFVCIF